jgi:hypothetical protein
MEKFTANLLANLYVELQEIATEPATHILQYEKSYLVAEQTIKQLKDYMKSYNFKNNEEEIQFFKKVKPQFNREIIYFIELYHIEANKPVASGGDQRKYYEKALKRLMDFFDQNRDLYNYYLTDKKDMDHIYFLRTEAFAMRRPLFISEMDQQFSTPYSLKLAQLQAYEQLCIYINDLLSGSNAGGKGMVNAETDHDITWTSSNVDLLELAIGLYFSGAVNFGKGGLTRVVNALQIIFKVRIGNVSRTMMSMEIRKKDQTPFLHGLEKSVVKVFEERGN